MMTIDQTEHSKADGVLFVEMSAQLFHPTMHVQGRSHFWNIAFSSHYNCELGDYFFPPTR